MLFSSEQIDPLDSKIPTYILRCPSNQPLIRNAIRNKWSGALAGYFYITHDNLLKKVPNALYNKFLKYLIRNKANILTTIIKLKDMAEASKDGNKAIINKAVSNILYSESISGLTKLRTDICHAFKGFLLLSYTPHYTFFEILNIMKEDNASDNALSLIAKLLGAYLGLENLMKQGLKLSSNTVKQIKTITESNMSFLCGD
jgi:hypothetical protein